MFKLHSMHVCVCVCLLGGPWSLHASAAPAQQGCSGEKCVKLVDATGLVGTSEVQNLLRHLVDHDLVRSPANPGFEEV